MRSGVLVLVLAAAACSGIDYADFADEQRDATCGYYVRCGSFGTFNDCRAYFERFEGANTSFGAAIDAGKIRFNEDTAEDCIDAFDDLDCDLADQDAQSLEVCDYVFSGTLAFNEACAFNAECESERCIVPDCSDACCIGTCGEPRVYPGVDEPCSNVCDDGLYCGFDQICHPYALEGEPCNALITCVEPYYCSRTTDTCARRPERGEPCDGPCASEGLVCNSDALCVDAGVSGDPCITANDCSIYYICDIDKRTCELPIQQPALDNGKPCTANSECKSRYCDALCMDAPICI